MEQVNERSTAYLSVSFRDKSGAIQTPATVTYRIDDVESGSSIRPATTLVATGSVEIVLTPSDNVIVGINRESELHRITVEATYGVDDAVREQYIYKVANLRSVA